MLTRQDLKIRLYVKVYQQVGNQVLEVEVLQVLGAQKEVQQALEVEVLQHQVNNTCSLC